jgi:hypothetical protein
MRVYVQRFSKASTAEINTGTEDNKYITPDALAGSNAFTKTVQQYCVEWGTELAVEEGVGYIEYQPECNGMNLISARARVGTAGVTGNTTFDIYNVTDSQQCYHQQYQSLQEQQVEQEQLIQLTMM